MRVFMFSWEYPPHVVGGLGRHVAEIAPALACQGVEIHLVTPRWAGGEEREIVVGQAQGAKSGRRKGTGSLTVYRIDPGIADGSVDFYTNTWQTNLRLEVQAEALLDELGSFDLIHAHDWLVAFVAAALKRAHKIPLLTTIHATERGRARGDLHTDLQRAIHSVEWWLTYEAWRVICCSKYMADEVSSLFQVPPDKIDVVPNGTKVEPFVRWDGVDLAPFRAMYALPTEQIVLFVGRLVYEKGAHILVEAVPKVLAAIPAAKFVIVGTGGAMGAFQRRAWELGVGHKVLFTGFISDEDRDRLLKVAACAVFPSLYEPFGIVALEAMAARCPVVVSEAGGLREVVQHGETGVTAYPGNVDSLAWGILHVLQHPEWTAARVEKAYQKVITEYNWDRIAERTKTIYERIVRERAATDW
jgi:glycogen(starch) synthase